MHSHSEHSHSEEVWESFDALWRRIKMLARQVSELESRLEAVEQADAHRVERGFDLRVGLSERVNPNSICEGEIGK